MNIKLDFSHNIRILKLNKSLSNGFTNNYQKKEMKSVEKEQKFLKQFFPKVFTDKINKITNNASRLGKKIKGMSLSAESYNKYMINYKNLLKHPTNNFYSTEKIKDYIPFSMIKNANLNKKRLFNSSLKDLGKISQISLNSNLSNNCNNKNLLIQKKIGYSTYYEGKESCKNKETEEEVFDDEKTFKYFIEGTFLQEPEKMKYININEKQLHPHTLNQTDYDFYSKYLENLYKNENFTDIKTKEFEMSFFNKGNKLKFILELQSMCLCFEEIDINRINNEEDMYSNKVKKKKIHLINIPFKYLPMFFLLSYSSLKVFISEIIDYNIEDNKFKIKANEKLEQIVKKYSEYCQHKINMHNYESYKSIYKDIIYYQNEFHFNYIFPWIVYNNKNNDNDTKCFSLKIIFPLINFQPSDYGIKFQKFSSKWLIYELVKNNFLFWDRYLLYSLFMNKKFRKTITYILNKKRNHISYDYTTKVVGPIIDDSISKKNNFDFFVTETLNSQNHFYFFAPYKGTISLRKHSKYELNDSLSLNLGECKKINRLSKYFGIIGAFNKFLLFNKLTKKYYFSFKFLQDLNQDYFSVLKINKKYDCLVNKMNKEIFKFNGKEYHLIIRECLLGEKIINIYNFSELKYYKIPNELLFYLLENDTYDNEIFSILINNSDKIINISEIEEYREIFFQRNNINDSSSSMSKVSKDKTKRKGNNYSNTLLKKVEIQRNSEKCINDKSNIILLDKNRKESSRSLLREMTTKRQYSNKNVFNISSYENEDKEPSLIEKQTKEFTIKSRNNTKIFNIPDKTSRINIENIRRKSEYGNISFISNKITDVNNKKQLELMRIKRNSVFPRLNNNIEIMKFNPINNLDKFNYMKNWKK